MTFNNWNNKKYMLKFLPPNCHQVIIYNSNFLPLAIFPNFKGCYMLFKLNILTWHQCKTNTSITPLLKFRYFSLQPDTSEKLRVENPAQWHFMKCGGICLRKSCLWPRALQLLNRQLHNLHNLNSTRNSRGLLYSFNVKHYLKKSHTCEEHGAHLIISFWYLLMNLKNK